MSRNPHIMNIIFEKPQCLLHVVKREKKVLKLPIFQRVSAMDGWEPNELGVPTSQGTNKGGRQKYASMYKKRPFAISFLISFIKFVINRLSRKTHVALPGMPPQTKSKKMPIRQSFIR